MASLFPLLERKLQQAPAAHCMQRDLHTGTLAAGVAADGRIPVRPRLAIYNAQRVS